MVILVQKKEKDGPLQLPELGCCACVSCIGPQHLEDQRTLFCRLLPFAGSVRELHEANKFPLLGYVAGPTGMVYAMRCAAQLHVPELALEDTACRYESVPGLPHVGAPDVDATGMGVFVPGVSHGAEESVCLGWTGRWLRV